MAYRPFPDPDAEPEPERERPFWQDCLLERLDRSGPRRVRPPRCQRRVREHLASLAADTNPTPGSVPDEDERTDHARHR